MLFFIYKSLQCFLPSFKSFGLLIQEKKRRKDYQDGSPCGHLGFLIRTILAIFYLEVTLMLPTKFQVHWPFSPGEEVKQIFKMVAMAVILDI